MAPTIHVIRHAQAVHNATHNPELHDPELTELGYQQCQELAAELASLGDVELVFASPMQRSIQTGLAAFETYTQSKRIVLVPDVQETDLMPTGTGSSVHELLSKYGDERLDFCFMSADWTDKSPQSRFAPHYAAVRARSTRLFLRAVAQRFRDTDANIVVITHLMFIDYLVGAGGTNFKNAERRSYRFEQLVGDNIEARLVETPCSIARRQKAAAAPKPVLPNPFGVKIPSLDTHSEAFSIDNLPGMVPVTYEPTGVQPMSWYS
ncbi:histidine phosphatase superfamily [Xylaria longipes]|nr:histidine phosphatase superfamily [Xylaria longipes]